jgi:hypothetical protein
MGELLKKLSEPAKEMTRKAEGNQRNRSAKR